MTLLRYNRPNRDLFSKNFSDVMDEFFNDVVSQRNNNFVPGIEISETENEFQVTAELPGMSKENIDVSLDNGRLTISGERKFEDKQEGKTYHRVETRYGSFNRSFQLPDNVDEESINATYKDGLLHITIEKDTEKVKKQIEIQ
ncbi:MAG: Hsp20/alpha crystallin family protein [Balneolaceae bacterium]|nr:Hsp20/alpha crystallin family protein [Balneolaceae bacterium]